MTFLKLKIICINNCQILWNIINKTFKKPMYFMHYYFYYLDHLITDQANHVKIMHNNIIGYKLLIVHILQKCGCDELEKSMSSQ